MMENNNLVQFIFNQNREVIAEQETEWTSYIRGSTLLASSADHARTYYHYASDEMSSITHIVDDEKVLNEYEYDAWGEVVKSVETVKNRFKFNGQQLDPITQQYYLRARFYNPVIARFTQEDTYRGDGLNLYAYCRNNPTYYVDPTGNARNCVKDAYDAIRTANPGMSATQAHALAMEQAGVERTRNGSADNYYFRGTSSGYPGNQSVQRAGVTPTSSNPLVSTIFAIEGENFGDGTLHIARDSDLQGVSRGDSNYMKEYEREVVFNILPSDFAERASITVSSQEARSILIDMGFELPRSISNNTSLGNYLRDLPDMSNDQILQFVDACRQL